jgi:DNA-binding NarL/FixJ family response regulator
MRILIADEKALFRDALGSLVESHGCEVVAECEGGAEVIELAQRLSPDIILLSVSGSFSDVAQLTGHLAEYLPASAVIILTEDGDEEVLFEAIRSGAKGYLTRDLDGDDFCRLLERAHRGEPALSPALATRLLEAFARSPEEVHRPRAGSTGLTDREREVLENMARGTTSNRELAEALGVSENTVRFHVRNILGKLHLHTRAAAVAYALTHGLVGSGSDS